ncbi:hypothetical protein CEXT_444321 [Caerostris extrusa]|uniref:Uncharacterized protein n=1 Tax=Caerostris extrusa TaxID=172846 RepID=A0AAV4XL10_CAEEX|nr:hypothetical protein CEXT_444321 [Caerostris extrusa]
MHFVQKEFVPYKKVHGYLPLSRKQFLDHLHRCANGDILWELERAPSWSHSLVILRVVERSSGAEEESRCRLPKIFCCEKESRLLLRVRKAWRMCVPPSPYSVEPLTRHLRVMERSSVSRKKRACACFQRFSAMKMNPAGYWCVSQNALQTKEFVPYKGSRRFISVKKQFTDHVHLCANCNILWELERAFSPNASSLFRPPSLQHVSWENVRAALSLVSGATYLSSEGDGKKFWSRKKRAGAGF